MPGRHERRDPVTPRASLGRAAAAAAAGAALLALTGAGGTGASWTVEATRHPGALRSGGIDLTTGTPSVRLHSRQPVDSRTYGSSTSCTPDAGYVECRDITTTIGQEALVPGDRVVLTQQVTLTGRGTNLAGTFRVDPGTLTSSTLSGFSGAAQTTTSVTTPGGGTTSGTGAVDVPVSGAGGQGLGTYTVRSVVTTPPARTDGTAWAQAFQGQQLYAGALTYTFTQS